MADFYWRGRAIFADLADRDSWYHRFHDYLDGRIGVMEEDDPQGSYQAGLALQNNVNGQAVSGPAFTWSLRVPQGELGDTESSPPGTFLASELDETINDIGAPQAEVMSTLAAIPGT